MNIIAVHQNVKHAKLDLVKDIALDITGVAVKTLTVEETQLIVLAAQALFTNCSLKIYN